MTIRLAAKSSENGLSLAELLVVITIIGLLAGMLMPALVRARKQARVVKCTAQLRQFGTALKTYQADEREYPPWLSNLVPDYLSEKILVCPDDYANPPGSEGRLSDTIDGLDGYTELDDIETAAGLDPVFTGKGRFMASDQREDPAKVRGPLVRYNSYSYEFAIPRCSYWVGGDYPDDPFGNRDAVVSWREVKTIAESDGIVDKLGNRDPEVTYHGRVPIVRCFWHIPPGSTVLKRSDARMIVLNLRSGDMSVSRSDATEEGWKRE